LCRRLTSQIPLIRLTDNHIVGTITWGIQRRGLACEKVGRDITELLKVVHEQRDEVNEKQRSLLSIIICPAFAIKHSRTPLFILSLPFLPFILSLPYSSFYPFISVPFLLVRGVAHARVRRSRGVATDLRRISDSDRHGKRPEIGVIGRGNQVGSITCSRFCQSLLAFAVQT
jgi:hypothetical protein